MARAHHYNVKVEWTGNTGTGTSSFREYDRRHEISAGKKPSIRGSSDTKFLGDSARWNPEELLVAALSACHQLWYLHLCSDAGIVVMAYTDGAEGVMEEAAGGSGQFRSVTLHPKVTVAPGTDVAKARGLHEAAHAKCFIANSVNFPVGCEPVVVTG